MSDTSHTESTHTESTGLSSGIYIAAFLVLFIILAAFGDLFTFIVGSIGLVVTFAAFSNDNSHGDAHH